ncbi:MAG TPA: UDP-3-O-(3-hydroxymyristoyl)glucosamine N-acyltransferase [Anaeromyxobacteraceae bacterium]|nr:UDP-3-O-(3-hydroxymyristoyl)glucosamine N-acyltransferase [Anaeromyxobacteraceae bacterium]
MQFTVAELAQRVGGEVLGDGSLQVDRVAPLEQAGPGALSFFSNRKYRGAYEATSASVVVVASSDEPLPGRTVIRARDPYLAYAKIATLFNPPRRARGGISPQAFVHPDASVDPTAEVMPLASVAAGARIGPRTTLHPGVQIGEDVAIGADCILYANVVVREGCVVRDRCILQPGVVLGSDGFGFAFDAEGEGAGPRHYKVPQTGNVIVEEDVEIGANTCVDRAALGATVIGRGAKIDNLVQIAHNVQVGALSILVSQVGIAGSTKLGMGVVAAGQVGIVGHLDIGDGAKIGAQSGIMNDVDAGDVVMGSPSRPRSEWLRIEASLAKLPELLKRVRELEKQLEKLGDRS